MTKPSHDLVRCFNCNRLVWSEAITEIPVRQGTSGDTIDEDFCPPCIDEIEARSRNHPLYETIGD